MGTLNVTKVGYLYQFNNEQPIFSASKKEWAVTNNKWKETELFKLDDSRYCGNCGQWADGPISCCNHSEDAPFVNADDAVFVRISYALRKQQAKS